MPSAVPERSPKLDRMSCRTMPLSARTLGPLDPSPGKGRRSPAGRPRRAAAADVVEDAPPVVEVELDDVARGAPVVGAAGHEHDAGAGAGEELQRVAAVDRGRPAGTEGREVEGEPAVVEVVVGVVVVHGTSMPAPHPEHPVQHLGGSWEPDRPVRSDRARTGSPCRAR